LLATAVVRDDTNHGGKEVCEEMNISGGIKYKSALFLSLLFIKIFK
jgi:hypothetical protein